MKRDLLDDFGPDPELTRWLVEAGRRRSRASSAVRAPDVKTSGASPRLLRGTGSIRRLLLLAVLALAILQYSFADTALRIATLHSLIVFVAA